MSTTWQGSIRRSDTGRKRVRRAFEDNEGSEGSPNVGAVDVSAARFIVADFAYWLKGVQSWSGFIRDWQSSSGRLQEVFGMKVRGMKETRKQKLSLTVIGLTVAVVRPRFHRSYVVGLYIAIVFGRLRVHCIILDALAEIVLVLVSVDLVVLLLA